MNSSVYVNSSLTFRFFCNLLPYQMVCISAYFVMKILLHIINRMHLINSTLYTGNIVRINSVYEHNKQHLIKYC